MLIRSDIYTELQNIVKSDRHRWKSDAYDRAIDAALQAFVLDRPNIAIAELTLVMGKGRYDMPADFVRYLGSDWMTQKIPTWEGGYAPKPRIYAVMKAASGGGRSLIFSPAVNQKMIGAYGSGFEYRYTTKHVMNEVVEEGSVQLEDKPMFITRCLMALMVDLMASNPTNPVQLHHGMSSVPSNASPTAVYDALNRAYQGWL